ncbi:related to arachidonate 5-lipoxygenase [Rhynchosporium agropyri]|uniref:Manganese lipoxygenase n=1 Tax=Rhynchosporium agropyri TaxID=914238 RepID=A0A1E1KHQ8_9HELO|nr:related to arachidonate 5-lipoxygenase [Rhynchosporium agropyri]
MRFFTSIVFAAIATANATVLRREITNLVEASLPQFSNITARLEAISTKRQGWLYGPSLLGNASFFPAGTIGSARMQADMALFSLDSAWVAPRAQADLLAVQQAVANNGGLHSLDDYAHVLYDGQWTASVPGGTGKGILANYTQDLLFSMERLSLNCYPLRRLQPSETLPFTVDLNTTVELTTLSLPALLESGRLFIVDHSYQLPYPKGAGKYGASSTAYFFIHPISGDFLPLAIKTNVGADLIYTPLDSANDWLLAKIMFNENDIFHAQMFHLVASHDVAEIVHQAAMRTMSDEHPVMILLERLMFQAYAVRPAGNAVLFSDGGYLDRAFFINHLGAAQFVPDFYTTVGRFQANYLSTDLASRGLLNSTTGPELKHFPFYDDAKVIHDGIFNFMTTFINAYYPSEDLLTIDPELSAWFTEASTSAAVLDFPCAPKDGQPTACDRSTLIEILTHMAYLTGVQHHALNTGDPVYSSGTLPFHPTALYSPLPTTKNISDTTLLAMLPPPSDAIFQIYLLAIFNRPQFEAQYKTLVHAFSEPSFLARFKGREEVERAAVVFRGRMEEVSGEVRGRGFDEAGLWKGMPFVYRSLDPGTVPFFLAV